MSKIFVFSGASGVGKSSALKRVMDTRSDLRFSVSATTREQRPGEVDGVDYTFVTAAEFDRMIAENELLEWANIHRGTHRSGTPRAPIEQRLAAGRPALVEVDLQGARELRRTMPEAFLVFLCPPSWEALVERLVGRGTEDAEERERRLSTAKDEFAAQNEFDYRVVNRTVAEAAREVVDLMQTRGPSDAVQA